MYQYWLFVIYGTRTHAVSKTSTCLAEPRFVLWVFLYCPLLPAYPGALSRQLKIVPKSLDFSNLVTWQCRRWSRENFRSRQGPVNGLSRVNVAKKNLSEPPRIIGTWSNVINNLLVDQWTLHQWMNVLRHALNSHEKSSRTKTPRFNQKHREPPSSPNIKHLTAALKAIWNVNTFCLHYHRTENNTHLQCVPYISKI